MKSKCPVLQARAVVSVLKCKVSLVFRFVKNGVARGAPNSLGNDQSTIELIVGRYTYLPPRTVVDFAVLDSFNHSQSVQSWVCGE